MIAGEKGREEWERMGLLGASRTAGRGGARRGGGVRWKINRFKIEVVIGLNEINK